MENKDIVIEGDSNLSPEEFERMLLKHQKSLRKFIENEKYFIKVNEIKSALDVVKPYLSDNEFDELDAKLSRAVVKERYSE